MNHQEIIQLLQGLSLSAPETTKDASNRLIGKETDIIKWYAPASADQKLTLKWTEEMFFEDIEE